MTEPDEQLDLVDNNDIKFGTIGRSQIYSLIDNGGGNLRTACAFIRNKEGHYWIPRRTADKRIAPNGLDFAMAEHMGVDETYLDAAVRGFSEELNMHIAPRELRPIGILGPIPKMPYFFAIYIHETQETPNYNHADFQGARWMTAQEVIAEVNAGTPAKDLLVPAIQLILIQEARQ